VQVVELPWGCPIEIDIRETIGRSIWTAGVHDLAVVEVLYRLADPRSLAVDAGANIGAMTGLLAARAAEVWAFEPHPAVFPRLEANCARFRSLSGFAPCRIFRAALSDVDGEVQMETPGDFGSNQGTARVTAGVGTAVPSWRLDSLLGKREVGVMKVDVEGHEINVLRGAEEALTAGRIRHVVFEDHAGAGSPVCHYLRQKGYTLLEVGWRLGGPVVAEPGSGAHRSYEAPSYLATRDPEGVSERCDSGGWKCLRGQRRSRLP
jgi:FkbM family methyltransferase